MLRARIFAIIFSIIGILFTHKNQYFKKAPFIFPFFLFQFFCTRRDEKPTTSLLRSLSHQKHITDAKQYRFHYLQIDEYFAFNHVT